MNQSKSSSIQKINNVIAVAAGKGGVGKSSVAVNLAYSLCQLGLKVGLLDADLYGPSLGKMLKVDKLPSQTNEQLEPALCHGMKVMSLAYFKQPSESLAVRAPIANRLVGQFIDQVNWGELDVLVVDFPPGTGDIQLSLAQKLPFSGAVMVTTPQEVATLDVKKAMDLFLKTQVPIYGVVENMSFLEDEQGKKYYPFGKEGGKQLAEETGVPLLAQLALEPALSKASDEGVPLLLKEPRSKVAQNILDMAKALLPQWTQKAQGEQELVWS